MCVLTRDGTCTLISGWHSNLWSYPARVKKNILKKRTFDSGSQILIRRSKVASIWVTSEFGGNSFVEGKKSEATVDWEWEGRQ